MQAKLIRRNATRQQSTIFGQIKSAKCVVAYDWESKESAVNDLNHLPEIYAGNRNALLLQVSEDEYQLVINEDKRYILSTKEEAIAPSTTEETTQVAQEIEDAIAPAESTPVEEPMQPKANQKPATLKGLETELCFTELELKDCEEKIDSTKGFIKMLKNSEGKTDDMEGKMTQLQARLQHLQNEAETLENEVAELKRKIKAIKIASTPVEEPTQATEKASLDSPTATTITSLDDQLAATEEEYNQAWEEVEKLEAELEGIKASYQEKINIALVKAGEIAGNRNQLRREKAIAKSQLSPKFDIVSIELTREESCDDDQPNHIATPIWLEANKMLYRWAKTAPKTGHQQCTAKLVFSDGNSITTPIKLNYWSFDALKSITNELDPQYEISWHEITKDEFLAYLATHKLNTKNLVLA